MAKGPFLHLAGTLFKDSALLFKELIDVHIAPLRGMMKAKDKRTPAGWSNHRIKYELAERGYSLSRIAKDYGYTCPCTPGDALRKPYPVMERIMAGIIGVHPMVIWPGRYDDRGNPLHKRGKSQGRK